jgi:hypothetical protein
VNRIAALLIALVASALAIRFAADLISPLLPLLLGLAGLGLLIRWLLILSLLIVGCQSKTHGLIEEYKEWWDSLSDVQQETIIRQNVTANIEAYRMVLTDKQQEIPEFVRIAEWNNGLTPGQIESFKMYRMLKAAQVRDPKSAAAMTGIMNAVPQRVPVCRGGAWVRS